MRLGFSIKQKIKIACTLGFIMLLVVVTHFLGMKNIDSIDESFASIYQDRLIPATEIIYLTEDLYSKRLLMQQYLLAGRQGQAGGLQQGLHQHNRRVDSLILEFEKTYLLAQESVALAAFKQRAQEYALLEEEILALSRKGASTESQALFEREGTQVFQATMSHLHQLTQIQSDAGMELTKDSRVMVASTNILSGLQIGLAVIMAIIMQVLILTSRRINLNPKKFSLN